jgi:hypothetical protein
VALGLGTAAVVLVVLLWELARPRAIGALKRLRAYVEHRRARSRAAGEVGYDPGRERRAEQRARELLRSCVDARDWAMYRDLGFLRVWGGIGERSPTPRAAYANQIYTHPPIVADLPQTRALQNE